MRGLVLAALAMAAGPVVPKPSPPPANPPPCKERKVVQADEPSAAQRILPGLF